MTKFVESKVRVKFLKLLEKHKLFKFICLNKKHNPNHAKAFYCNLKVSDNGFECVFRNQVIKFMLDDFKNQVGLVSKGNKFFVSNGANFGITEFIQSISNFVFKECLDLDNFHIS